MDRKLTKAEKEPILFLLKHCLIGLISGLCFGVLMLAFDVGGLRTLAFQSPDTILILTLLFFGLFVTFGSIAMGAGIMGLGNHGDEPPLF